LPDGLHDARLLCSTRSAFVSRSDKSTRRNAAETTCK
jgi:hypothetical protein